MEGDEGRGGAVDAAVLRGWGGEAVGWGGTCHGAPDSTTSSGHSPLVCSGSRGTYRALSLGSHFPFSLPRQMFFSASLIPVAGL